MRAYIYIYIFLPKTSVSVSSFRRHKILNGQFQQPKSTLVNLLNAEERERKEKVGKLSLRCQWLTLHTWSHRAIFSTLDQLLTRNSGTRLPILNGILLYKNFARTEQKTLQQYLYCCMFTDLLLINGFFYCCVRVHFRGNLFIEPLPINELFRVTGVMSQY
jgi:hypothetical protein